MSTELKQEKSKPRKPEPRVVTEQQVFPTRLRELMEEHGTTQKVLAAAIGMRPQTVSLYTGGQSSPDINTLYKIAEFFNVPTDWLVGRPDSVKTFDKDITAICAYTGLSQKAVQIVSNLKNTGHDAGIRVLNQILENADFWNAVANINYAEYAFRNRDKPMSKVLEEELSELKLTNALERHPGGTVLKPDGMVEYNLFLASKRFNECAECIIGMKTEKNGGEKSGKH